MKLHLGIDLGSTTTKAVLLDENKHILGRGITNTRSDYEVATSVAEQEARTSARFTVLRRHAEAAGLDPAVLDRLQEEFAVRTFLYRLERLRRLAIDHAVGGPGEHPVGIAPSLDGVFDCIRDDVLSDPRIASRVRNSFFRDVVGASFMSLCEEIADDGSVDFEDLMAVYDTVILLEENTMLDLDFETTIQDCPSARDATGSELRAATAAACAVTLDIANMVGTGYGRQRLPFRKDQIRSEILCHGFGAHFFFPRTRTVLDIGGQDTKAIQVDDHGIATNFQMNDRCAAGCGRYLGYIADELSISLDELGPLALEASHAVAVSSTCTVFAGAELREKLDLGEKRENILAGLHRAIVLRAMSLLARSGGVREEFTFTGGVARNPAAVKELRSLIAENYGDLTLNIHPDSIYTGAVGAALYAGQDVPARDVVEVP